METVILDPQSDGDIERAGDILRQGGLVAIPTETVYGLAANALDEKAVEKIYKAKGRPGDNPLIVHVCSLEDAAPLVREIPETAQKLAAAFWPGPLTMILPKSDIVPSRTSGGLQTVAIRVPADETARKIIRAAGVPLAAPSANRSGRPSPTTFAHVWADMQGRADAVVNGGNCAVGLESTVLTLAEGKPRLLRPGGITPAQLAAVIGPVEVDPAVLRALEEGQRVSSPGMKYKHYAPKANITVSEHSFRDYQALLAGEPNAAALCFDEDVGRLSCPAVTYGGRYDEAAQARNLFAALHTLDEKGYGKVYARAPKKSGMGLAVYNRLIRAAGFQVLRPKAEIIGLTGPTGAGKSLVAQDLAKAGAAVIDCDAVSRDEETYRDDCILQLKNAFGSDILVDGHLQRRILAQKAFASPEGVAELNRITLPVISRRIEGMIADLIAAGKTCVVLDAPTLFEAGAEELCTGILVVTSSRKLRLKRIICRDGITEQEALRRMGAQKPSEYYVNRADWVVNTENGYIPGQAQRIITLCKGE